METTEDGSTRPVEGLNELYAERSPPEGLEDAVVEDLVADGLLDRHGRQAGGGWRLWAPRAAAALVLFAGGWAVGSQGDGTVASPMTTHMLLLWEGDGFALGAPGDAAEEYSAWASGVASTGVGISGDELVAARDTLGVPTTGGFVSGYFMLDTESPEGAVRIAADHPHVARGGWIEIAEVIRR